MLEQRHSVVVRPVSGPVEASGIDCVWPWSAGLLAVVALPFILSLWKSMGWY